MVTPAVAVLQHIARLDQQLFASTDCLGFVLQEQVGNAIHCQQSGDGTFGTGVKYISIPCIVTPKIASAMEVLPNVYILLAINVSP